MTYYISAQTAVYQDNYRLVEEIRGTEDQAIAAGRKEHIKVGTCVVVTTVNQPSHGVSKPRAGVVYDSYRDR